MRHYALILLLLLASCHKPDFYGYKEYTISEGSHYSNEYLNFRPLQDARLHQSIYFGYECWYEEFNVTHSGYNKLTGLSQIAGVHNKSGRIVWQPDYDSIGYIRLSGYVYGAELDTWTAKYISTVKTGERFDIKVNCLYNRWEFFVEQDGVINGKIGRAHV